MPSAARWWSWATNMSSVSTQSAKPAWRAAIVLLTNGPVPAVGHDHVGVDERVVADEARRSSAARRGRAARRAPPTRRRAGAGLGRTTSGVARPASCRAAAAMAGHTSSQLNTSPFVRLNVPPAAAGRRRRPHQRAGHQVGVDRLAQRRAASRCREVQRLAGGSLQRGVHGDRRERVHVVCRGVAVHDRRAEDRQRPAGAPLLRPQVVLLQPVEVRVLGAAARVRAAGSEPRPNRSTGGARRRPWCPAAARRARTAAGRERVEQVAQHRCVALDQLVLVPARQQARALLERGVDEVGDRP